MAYTIISQNNNTTTLTDGVNTITVPSRVNLTSGNFTIVEVNNNMATLEDGDGNVYRDIPCVVNLVDAGGGGGTVDKSKIVNADTIPEASASNAGYVYLYTGTTNASYTHGYVYQNVKSATYTGTVSFEAATLSGTTVACSGDNFATFLTEAGADPTPIVSGTMTYEADATGWRLVGKDSNGNTVTTFMEYVEDYQDAGFTFTGTPQDGDVIAFTCSVTEASATYTWTRIDVQPAPSGLPDQTGQSGKFLTTDGTDASWSDKPLVNKATRNDALTLLGTAASSTGAINIGDETVASGVAAISVGLRAQATKICSIAIARQGTASADYAIQLGGWGQTNSDANTFKVANGNGNYEIMSANGTIPTARFTTDPVSDGTYYPTLTISSGTPTRSWSTISALQNMGTGSSLGLNYYNGSVTASGNYSIAIGDSASGTGQLNIAIGKGAKAGGSGYNIVLGTDAKSLNGTSSNIVIGGYAESTSTDSIAIGSQAKTAASRAIQIGRGTNSDANTLKVGFYDNVAQSFVNYELLSSDGTIPADRLASTTGLADGNYRLRLTMASGVPTLSWVAE